MHDKAFFRFCFSWWCIIEAWEKRNNRITAITLFYSYETTWHNNGYQVLIITMVFQNKNKILIFLASRKRGFFLANPTRRPLFLFSLSRLACFLFSVLFWNAVFPFSLVESSENTCLSSKPVQNHLKTNKRTWSVAGPRGTEHVPLDSPL